MDFKRKVDEYESILGGYEIERKEWKFELLKLE
jgi:hypothetical protein